MWYGMAIKVTYDKNNFSFLKKLNHTGHVRWQKKLNEDKSELGNHCIGSDSSNYWKVTNFVTYPGGDLFEAPESWDMVFVVIIF